MNQQNIPLLVVHMDGAVEAAILMAVSGNRLRTAIPAQADIVEFKWDEGQWKTEAGEPVEIEFDADREEFSRCAQAAMTKMAGEMEDLPFGSWSRYEESMAFTLAVN